jgi:ABC-type transport system involved in multi-copper enzyme maturation permease subunit
MGLAMFATLFLGAVLATFLTMGVVRGDAESGMLQPLVARPADRTMILIGRFAGAALVSAAYVIVVFFAATAIVAAIGDWSPERPEQAALLLALAVVAVAAISLVASVWLSATAQGIAVLMIYGGGLTAGLLGQIGESLDSERLEDISTAVSWALPFEAVYQDALVALVPDTGGIAQIVVELGPFGGGESGGFALLAWVAVYLVAVIAVAAWGFRRRDL